VTLGNRFEIRLGTADDLEQVAELERLVWEGQSAATEDLHRRLADDGHETVLVFRGEQLLAFAQLKWVDVEVLLGGDGTFSAIAGSPSRPDGAIGYGINLSAHGGVGGAGAGRAALAGLLGLVAHRARPVFLAGGRIPGLRAWSEVCTPETYLGLVWDASDLYHRDSAGVVRRVCSRERCRSLAAFPEVENWAPLRGSELARVALRTEPLDPFLRMISSTSCCGRSPEVHGLLPSYFGDPESMNYGVLYSWSNPFHGDSSRIVDHVQRSLEGLGRLRRGPA
jgi:hypothetical protein